MDFKSLRDRIVQKSKDLTQATKDLGKKALSFTGKQLSSTPLYIQTNEEYAVFLGEKRSIVIAYDENNEEIAQYIVLMMPVWGTQAFLDVATLRYMNLEKSRHVIITEKFQTPIEMRVRYENIEQYRLQDLASVQAWWKERKYQSAPSTPLTPLASPEQKPSKKESPAPMEDPLASTTNS